MRTFIKSFIATLFAFGVAASSQATPVVSVSAAGQQTSTVAGATTINFESGCGYASCSGDFTIANGFASGLYAQPYDDYTNYLSVPNPSTNNHTYNATFGLGTTSNYFGLYWGSIDSYNAISFYLNGVQVGATLWGNQIQNLISDGNQSSWASNRYINFDFGNDMFDTVQLTSNGFAFESDNHAYRQVSSVPEPTTLVLFVLGLCAVFAARRFARI